jgi:hypothetical protein
MLDNQIEKANAYSETLNRQRIQLKTRLDSLEENPTYQAELNQSLSEMKMEIERLKKQHREKEVRQNMQSLSIVKQTKQGEDSTADHVLKLKDRHDEYQVVIHNLTLAENTDAKTKLQIENLDAGIAQLKS